MNIFIKNILKVFKFFSDSGHIIFMHLMKHNILNFLLLNSIYEILIFIWNFIYIEHIRSNFIIIFARVFLLLDFTPLKKGFQSIFGLFIQLFIDSLHIHKLFNNEIDVRGRFSFFYFLSIFIHCVKIKIFVLLFQRSLHEILVQSFY